MHSTDIRVVKVTPQAKCLHDKCCLTHLSHPEGYLINLVDGHKCLHVVKQEDIVEDGGEESQRAIEHCSRNDALPEAPDAPAHSSFSVSLLRPFSVQNCNHLMAWPSLGHHIIMA